MAKADSTPSMKEIQKSIKYSPQANPAELAADYINPR